MATGAGATSTTAAERSFNLDAQRGDEQPWFTDGGPRGRALVEADGGDLEQRAVPGGHRPGRAPPTAAPSVRPKRMVGGDDPDAIPADQDVLGGPAAAATSASTRRPGGRAAMRVVEGDADLEDWREGGQARRQVEVRDVGRRAAAASTQRQVRHAVEDPQAVADRERDDVEPQLVDQLGAQCGVERRHASRDRHVAVAAAARACATADSMPSVTKWKVVPPPSPPSRAAGGRGRRPGRGAGGRLRAPPPGPRQVPVAAVGAEHVTAHHVGPGLGDGGDLLGVLVADHRTSRPWCSRSPTRGPNGCSAAGRGRSHQVEGDGHVGGDAGHRVLLRSRGGQRTTS